MNTDSDVQRNLGQHDAQLDDLDRRVERIENKLDEIITSIHEAKGGWKTLMLIGGAAGAMGAFLGKFLPFFFK